MAAAAEAAAGAAVAAAGAAVAATVAANKKQGLTSSW